MGDLTGGGWWQVETRDVIIKTDESWVGKTHPAPLFQLDIVTIFRTNNWSDVITIIISSLLFGENIHIPQNLQ